MRYELDNDRSRLDIHASSSVHPIHTAAHVEGWIEATVRADGSVDTGKDISGAVQLDLGGMRSGNPLIDRESERRLDIDRYPTVQGELNALGPTERPDEYTAAGTLTFHGVTHDISGVLRVEQDGGGLSVVGETTIDITDFNVKPPSLLVLKVHKDVRVELHAVAVAGGRPSQPHSSSPNGAPRSPRP